MASPHTAGLLAYLLSIYPSEEFDPSFDSDDELVSLQSQRVLSSPFSGASSPSSVYVMVHKILPPFIASYLPAPEFFDLIVGSNNAPIPKPLTPLQLKKALLALSTPDLLAELPSKTPNLLIFNNATTYY